MAENGAAGGARFVDASAMLPGGSAFALAAVLVVLLLLKAWDGHVSRFHGCHELGSFDFDGFLAAVLILFFKSDDDTILYLGGTAYAQLYVFLMAVIKP